MVKLDWRQAFNSMEHSRLYAVLRRLGFPSDSIAAVRSIYDRSETVVETPHGLTEPIKIRRGVIQGDTLSPLLFNIMLEPLLRWLETGNKGYELQSVKAHTARACVLPQHTRVASSAYADDTCLLTGNENDMQTQCNKVSLFSAWSGLYVHAGKTTASAVLHATARPTSLEAVRRQVDGLRICGEPMKLLPPNEPFKYLGVWFTLTANWTRQHEEADQLVSERVARLAEVPATPLIAQKLEEGCILGALRHTFCVCPYTPNMLLDIDKVPPQ